MRKFFSILLMLPYLLYAQIGGQLGYQSLNLTTNSRSAALSGSSISLADGDISQFFENPAVLDSVASRGIFFHINPYFSDVLIYSMAYSFDIKDINDFALGLNYVDYGSFERTDETGMILGTFSASDYVLYLGKAHQLGPFTLGASLKFINSKVDTYSSSALAFDLAGIFRINKNWTLGTVFENIGGQLTNNSEINSTSLPFDVKIGTSFKPEYMPIRFTFTSINLIDQNLSLNETTSVKSTSAFDKMLKRIHLGAEVLLSKHFQLLFGYNHKRKQELKLETRSEGAGFSYGLMVKVKRIQFRFSRATYHAAGGSSFISLQSNLRDFKQIL
ncbi:MAG: type IX secretion system protein PorQ [Bacteroidota bacterium]